VPRRLPRPPRPLSALLAASLLVTVAWALLIPPFHAPDEDGHYAYAQSLAENLTRPPFHDPAVTHGPQLSPSVRMAEAFARTGSFWLVERDSQRPFWDGYAQRRYEAALRAHPPPSDRVDTAEYQSTDPPLYHAWAAIAYRVASTPNVFSRLFAMRLWTAPLVLLTVLGAWLLAGELFGPDRTLQLVVAGCVGLQPMVTFMSSGVNPDAAALPASAFVLWLTVRVVRRKPSRRVLLALAASLVAAVLSKTVLISLLPAAAVALVVALRRFGRWPRRGWAVVAPALIAAVVVGLAVVAAASPDSLPPVSKLGGFFNYLWSYYSPRSAWAPRVGGLPPHPFYRIWLRGAWGEFGSADVHFPSGVYKVLALVSVATFAGAVMALIRRRFAQDRAVLLVAGLAAAGLVLGLHVGDYAQVSRFGITVTLGRYLLPLLPIAGVAAAVALRNLPPRWRLHGGALVLSSMFALDLVALGLVARRFYA